MLTIASKMIVFGKRFSILIIVLTFFCSSNALAMNLVSCDVDNVPQCAIYLKKINIQDEVSYDAQLTSKETNKPILLLRKKVPLWRICHSKYLMGNMFL